MSEDIDKIIEKLEAGIKAAKAHLEYCNYGDAWEKECAKNSGLEDQLNQALEDLAKYKKLKT